MAVFGDDGEKFGTWPETQKHVYDDGWLVRFFDALVQNQHWIQVTTLAEAFDNVPPVGKIYLPDCSYREMTEWALPTERLAEYQRIEREMHDDPRWASLRPFVRGGFWRNFKVKYPGSRRDVLPHDDGQPAVAGDARRGRGRRPGQRRAGRAGPHRALPRPVQLQLLARGVRRHLSAAPAQRRLPTPDRRRQPVGPGDRPAGDAGSKPRPTISTSTPAKRSA